MNKLKAIAVAVPIVFGVGFFRFGNHVVIPEDSLGFIQDIYTGAIVDEVLQPGSYYLPITNYVIQKKTKPSPMSVSIKIISKDKQAIPTNITVHSCFKEEDLKRVVMLYKTDDYQNRLCKSTCKSETQKVLGEWTLVDWFENYEQLCEEVTTHISMELEKKHLYCSDVELSFDTAYIKKLFRYFYTDDELADKPFFQTLCSLENNEKNIIEKE